MILASAYKVRQGFVMDDTEVKESRREEIRSKLREHFDGKIVRKDLTKKIKEGANVPVYVLEFLLVLTLQASSTKCSTRP